jgi:Ca2+-binding EF-hand superfamily protein
MRANRLVLAAAATALFAGPLSAQAAGSQSGHWSSSGNLLRQMDRDKNGTVSKAEFLQFMSQKFNRLDTNRNGKLEPNELRPLIRGR